MKPVRIAVLLAGLMWALVPPAILSAQAPTAGALPGEGGTAAVSQGSSLQEQFRQGEAALKNGDLNGAEAAFRRVISADPKSASAHTNLGVIAMRRKQWDLALTWLHKAEKLAPREPGIRLNIGLTYYKHGDYASAIAPFQSVVRDLPDSLQARYLLGLCDFFTEHYPEAVAALEPLWPQQSSDLNYLYVLGNAAHLSGRDDLDEKALGRLVAIGQDTAEFHLFLGKAYLNRGDEEATPALTELKRAESLDPNLPFLHFNLGLSYLRSGDNDRAEAEFLKDIALEPDVPENYEQLGILYSRMQRDQEAEHSYREALKRDARLFASHLGLARIFLRQERYEKALSSVEAALRLAPESQSAHYLRGQVLLRRGRQEEARAETAIARRLADASLNKEREKRAGASTPNPELTRRPD